MKKGSPERRALFISWIRLEADSALKLDDTTRDSRASERSIDAARRSHGCGDLSKAAGSNIVRWLIEVRVVEDVEEAGSDAEVELLGNLSGLDQRHIRIQIARSPELRVTRNVSEPVRWLLRRGGKLRCKQAGAVSVLAGSLTAALVTG